MLGVILVVKTSLEGDRLLFRYPPVVRSRVTEETLKLLGVQADSADKKGGEDKGGPSDPEKSGEAGGRGGDPAAPPFHDGRMGGQADPTGGGRGRTQRSSSAYALASSVLANFLLPKGTLCGHLFQVEMEDCLFVGYPLQVPHSPDGSSSLDDSDDGREEGEEGGEPEGGGGGGAGEEGGRADVVQQANLVFALPSSASAELRRQVGGLAKALGLALRAEERRAGYLSAHSSLLLRLRRTWERSVLAGGASHREL
jgi:hypothetical protein